QAKSGHVQVSSRTTRVTWNAVTSATPNSSTLAVTAMSAIQRASGRPARRTDIVCLIRCNRGLEGRCAAARPQEHPMYRHFQSHLGHELELIRAEGFYKTERVIRSPQGSQIDLANGPAVVNFCANNYLGLADDPR